MSRKNNHNIIKHRGQVNTAVDLHGKSIERAEYLFMKYNEQITFVKAAYDDVHFLYQNTIPVTDDDVITKYHGKLPPELQGDNVLCTCGSTGVLMLDGPHSGMALCKFVAQFGKHQTSFEKKNGKLILDKKTADERLMGDSDIEKTLKSLEQKLDEDNSRFH